ncbi:hypothetical protein TIFTF001_039246 [Ficus carica]|uniref:Uncharacterized protein n=1 Tax=Ficus carica TaxID=3494 RepID=A0AA88E8V0_FICCA|nr:hypothetical protein TIFTF001_039246 [Ficus carica]
MNIIKARVHYTKEKPHLVLKKCTHLESTTAAVVAGGGTAVEARSRLERESEFSRGWAKEQWGGSARENAE